MAYSIEEDLEKEINELRFKVKGLEFEVEQLRTLLDGAGEWVDWYDEETGEDDPKVFLKGRGKAGAIYRGISLSGLTTLTDKIVMVGGTKE